MTQDVRNVSISGLAILQVVPAKELTIIVIGDLIAG
jgi:hypothetical protein